MAFKAKESQEALEINRYTGVASCYVKGVNPNKDELSAFFGRQMDKEPEYVSTYTDEDGAEIPQVRVDFLVETASNPKSVNEKGEPIVMKTRVSFFLRKRARKNRDNDKWRVVDRYGYVGWATKEELDSHAQLLSSQGKALRITNDYRVAYDGEPELLEFIKCYLNIDEAMVWKDNKWTLNTDVPLPDCECNLQDMEKLFKGDFSELKEITKLMPNNKLKLLFGVRTAATGAQYQDVYTRMPMRNSVSEYGKLAKDVLSTKSSGGYPNTDFEVCDLKEHKVKATLLEKAPERPFNEPLPWDE